MTTVSLASKTTAQCTAACAGPCYIACAAGVETGAAALVIVTASFYFSNLWS